MRIRKRRPLGGSPGRQQEEQQQQQDASGAVINSGGLYARAKSPNSSTSSHDLKIPPSCLFSQGLRGALLLGNSSRYANRPQRQPAAATPGQYICEPATSGRISSQREVLMAKGGPGPSVDASELLHANAKYVDKSSSEELAAGATTGGERGCKKVRDDSVGSAGCKKNAHMGRPSDHAVAVDGHSLVSFSGQKVLPLELILSSGSHPARVSSKAANNTEVRLLSNNNVTVHADTGSSMPKVKEEEEAAEGGHKSRSKALETQLLALASSREPDQLVSLVKRRKLKKKERSAIRHDVVWLLSRLKGHRRVRSVGQRQRSQVSNALAALGQVMPAVGADHPSPEATSAGHPSVEATNEAAANLSLEQIKGIVPNEGSDACRSVQEKKKKKKIIKKKVAKIDINCMDTHASTSTNGEKIKGSTKKTKMVDQQPAARQVVVELEIKALKKRKREAKEQAVAVLERCKRRDGRDWQCREPVVKAGATYCEYHTLKIKENHARSAEKLVETPQVGLSKGSKKGKGSMDGGGCEAEEGDDEEKGGEQVVVVLRRRWRKKCKPCIRRLHEIQERALPAGAELKKEWEGDQEEKSVEATPWASSSPEETHEPPHIQLPECLLNTDPREWRSDFL